MSNSPALPKKEVSHALARYTKTTSTSLRFEADTPFEEWRQILAFKLSVKDSSQWWIGDALNFGEQHYGEKYAQAIEITGNEYQTLANTAFVARTFDFSRRRENLSFGHHEAVAGLPYQTADELLATAEKKRWNRQDLRDAAAVTQGKPTKAQRDAAKIGKTKPAKTPARGGNEPATIDVQATVTKGGDEPCATPQTQPATQSEPSSKQSPPTTTETSAPTSPQSTVASNAAQPSNPTAAAKPQEQPPERAEDALTIAEARLHQFVAAIPAMKAETLKPLQIRRWLHLLIDVDKLIDTLQTALLKK